MPKILMLTTDQTIDRRILLEADALEADGAEVRILATPGEGAADDPRVIRVAPMGDLRAGVSPELMMLRAYRWARRFVPMNGPWMTRLKSVAWRCVFSTDKVVRNLLLPSAVLQHADIVVAHDLPTLPAAAAAAERLGAELVYDSHELYCEQEFEPQLRRLWSKIERRYIHLCDAVITVNPSIARELERRYGLSLVHVVQNAVPYAAKPEKGRLFHEIFALNSAATVLLFQGGLLAGRHLETLVEAMCFVTAPSIHLVFLGDGPLLGRLRQCSIRLAVAERVHFHPAVPQSELLRYTASADLGIIPYQATCLNNLCCTPNKLFEYVVAGLPMIATDLPELRRLIVGNGIGIVADTASARGIAGAVDGLLANRMQLKALEARVLETRRRLNWEEESKVLLEVFRGLRC